MKVCVACQKNMEGKRAVPIKEDRIIKVIRTVKKTLGIAQMNELYVCETDLEEHIHRRRSFEKSMLFASVLAGLIVVVVLVALVLSGRFDPWSIVSALIIGAFILVLPLFKYSPAVETKTAMTVGVAPKPTAVSVAPPAKAAVPAAKKAAKETPPKKKTRKKKSTKKKR